MHGVIPVEMEWMHWQFGPIRLIRISYYGIFALTESLEGFGGATQLQDQRLLPRKRLSLLELPIDIPRLIQWKSDAQVRPILCLLFIQISFLMTTEDFDPGKEVESSKRCWQQSFSALFLLFVPHSSKRKAILLSSWTSELNHPPVREY